MNPVIEMILTYVPLCVCVYVCVYELPLIT